jgi:hypothetical protein
MAQACPKCESDHVVNWADYWKSLPQDAELKATDPQPAPYEPRWVIPIVLGAAAILCLTTGSGSGILLGVVLGLAAAGAVAWLHREAAEREAARAAWLKLLYCRVCTGRFPPDKALTV